ncbi:MAG: hypothetical protein WC464_02850 [Bdellovibrionales bacterium]
MVYLEYSAIYDSKTDNEAPERPQPGQIIQRHGIVCHAVDGRKYIFTVKANSPDGASSLKDRSVVGPFDEDKLIYLERLTGPVSFDDFERQLANPKLTQDEIDRVKAIKLRKQQPSSKNKFSASPVQLVF